MGHVPMAGLAVPSWELALRAAVHEVVHTASRLMPLLGSDVRHGGLRVRLLANLRGSCARCEGVHADESGFGEDGGYASDWVGARSETMRPSPTSTLARGADSGRSR
ncbi:hypothetical protein D7V80_10315 [Corallococcus sp. CA054B]|nr:hypothetical protein D7V80_10315 [Corallococcus sp. CA054B]